MENGERIQEKGRKYFSIVFKSVTELMFNFVEMVHVQCKPSFNEIVHQ